MTVTRFILTLLIGFLQCCDCKRSIRDHALSYNTSLINNITRLLDTILLNQDRNFRPINGDPNSPLQVEVDISVRSMGPISEQQMEFSMDCYFRQKWLDRRLAFNTFGNRKDLPIASKMLKDIWTPDTYIRNGRNSYLHTLTVPNVLFRVRYDGQVHVSQRLTIRTRCKMFFKKFPMDSQACPIEISSLGYFSKDVIYVWKDVELDSKMSNMLAQYQLLHVIKSSYNLTNPLDSSLSRLPSGRLPSVSGRLPSVSGRLPSVACFGDSLECHPFARLSVTSLSSNLQFTVDVSVLKVYFKLQRQQGFYILQIYTPCTLIVVMSWVSFWINKESSPARVALGIMTVLSMSTLGFGSRSDLPKVSHSTALDIYIISCFGFVFAAMIEYAVINYANIVYVRKQVHDLKGLETGTVMEKMRIFSASLMGSVQTDRIQHDTIALNLKPQPWYRRIFAPKENRSVFYRMAVRAAKAKEKLKMNDPTNAVNRIDSASKIVFPSLYILFNIIYWLAFLYWIPDEINNLIYLTFSFFKIISAPATAQFNNLSFFLIT